MAKILDQFGQPLPRSKPTTPLEIWQDRYAALRAKWDAAQTSDHNSEHWRWADHLAPDSAASPSVRKTLRSRSRYEAANNSWCRGIIETLANDTIGKGPRLQLLTPDQNGNERVELEWDRWTKAIGLPEKLRLMRMALAVDGETFAQFTTNRGLPTDITLDVQLTEADQITSPDLGYLTDPNAVDGIVYDSQGNPKTYHRLKYHPGDTTNWLVGLYLDYESIPASQVIHLANLDRPGQRRGVPEIAPALPLFAQLRRFALSALAAAEVASDFAAVMYTDSPALEAPEDVGAMDSVELEMRAMLSLPAGWKLGQLKTEFPPTTYEMVVRTYLGEIARCLSMPYCVAAGDASAHNYASGRLDYQVYRSAVEVMREHFRLNVLDRILAAWLDEAVLIPGLLPANAGQMRDWQHIFHWGAWLHVDPTKEATAQKTRLASRSTNLRREYAAQGLDWREELQQIAREQELMAELNITPQEKPSAFA